MSGFHGKAAQQSSQRIGAVHNPLPSQYRPQQDRDTTPSKPVVLVMSANAVLSLLSSSAPLHMLGTILGFRCTLQCRGRSRICHHVALGDRIAAREDKGYCRQDWVTRSGWTPSRLHPDRGRSELSGVSTYLRGRRPLRQLDVQMYCIAMDRGPVLYLIC
jgi:hypothetical protein